MPRFPLEKHNHKEFKGHEKDYQRKRAFEEVRKIQ